MIIKGIKVRFQNVDGLPPKELRKLVDEGKKDLGEGIVIVFASKEDKVGVAVGITNKLTDKFDAVKFVKLSSEVIGGQGGRLYNARLGRAERLEHRSNPMLRTLFSCHSCANPMTMGTHCGH